MDICRCIGKRRDGILKDDCLGCLRYLEYLTDLKASSNGIISYSSYFSEDPSEHYDEECNYQIKSKYDL